MNGAAWCGTESGGGASVSSVWPAFRMMGGVACPPLLGHVNPYRQHCDVFRLFRARFFCDWHLGSAYPWPDLLPDTPALTNPKLCSGRSAIEDGCTDVVVLCTRPKGSQVLGKVRPVKPSGRIRSTPTADGQGIRIFHADSISSCRVRAGVSFSPSIPCHLLPPRFVCTSVCAHLSPLLWRFGLVKVTINRSVFCSFPARGAL